VSGNRRLNDARFQGSVISVLAGLQLAAPVSRLRGIGRQSRSRLLKVNSLPAACSRSVDYFAAVYSREGRQNGWKAAEETIPFTIVGNNF
jgi:hypothetical protein